MAPVLGTIGAVPLPTWIARFNKRVTNRFIEPLVRRSSGFAIVHHTGRRSATPYRTPVNIFDAGDESAIVALTYGPAADWVQNVLASGGSVERVNLTSTIRSVTIVGRPEAWPYIPRIVRIALRILTVRHFMLIRLGDAAPESPD